MEFGHLGLHPESYVEDVKNRPKGLQGRNIIAQAVRPG